MDVRSHCVLCSESQVLWFKTTFSYFTRGRSGFGGDIVPVCLGIVWTNVLWHAMHYLSRVYSNMIQCFGGVFAFMHLLNLNQMSAGVVMIHPTFDKLERLPPLIIILLLVYFKAQNELFVGFHTTENILFCTGFYVKNRSCRSRFVK